MIKVLKDIQLSKNFSLSEFVCKDGSGEVIIEYGLIQKLQELRDSIKKPIIITSGYRSEVYNHKIGGVPDSQHILGKAADIIVRGMSPYQIAQIADQIGFNGIGLYKDFVHVDIRDYKARWTE